MLLFYSSTDLSIDEEEEKINKAGSFCILFSESYQKNVIHM